MCQGRTLVWPLKFCYPFCVKEVVRCKREGGQGAREDCFGSGDVAERQLEQLGIAILQNGIKILHMSSLVFE